MSEHISTNERIPLLSIEIHDLNSPPIVKLNGVNVEGKVGVDYSYTTGNLFTKMQQSYKVVRCIKTDNGLCIQTTEETIENKALL